ADVAALGDAALAPREGPRVRPEQELARARRLFDTGWRGYRWPAIAAELARLGSTLPRSRVELRVEVLSRLAAAQRHLGDPLGSLALLEQAQAIADSPDGREGVPDEPLVYLASQRAMTQKQLGRFAEARRDAALAVDVARRARLRGVLIRALGVAGLVALADEDPAGAGGAIDAFEASLEVALAHDPERTARTRAYLVEAYGAAGRADDCEAAREAAMAELATMSDPEERRATESWIRTSWGGALLALARPADAVDALDHPSVRVSLEEEPLPGLLARRWLGLALASAGADPARGFEVLAASPLVHGRALAPHLAFLAHLNVLHEAQARASAGAWTADVAGRAARALEHVPGYVRGEPVIAAAIARAADALARGEAPAPDALGALLALSRRG
ncbi:MAG: hypothetical protein KF729_38215, partial [Sandaracinaceae bacterium]|nr:hypothetical protein [Sandaracinaceae bacterium]